MAAKLYRGPNDGPNEGMVDLLVEKFQAYHDGAGYPVQVESVNTGVNKEFADWDKQFQISVDIEGLYTPGDQNDLDQPPRKVWRRLGVNQPVFDVSFVAMVTDRGAPNDNASAYVEDKTAFWGIITQIAVVLKRTIFGPGTRLATVVFSGEVPDPLLRLVDGIEKAQYVYFTIPAYFDKQSYAKPDTPPLDVSYQPAARHLYGEYTGDWPPTQLWKQIVANGISRKDGKLSFAKNAPDVSGIQQITQRGVADPPY